MSLRRKQTKVRKNYPKKCIKSSTEGNCPYCHLHVKSVEAHVKAKHREKVVHVRKTRLF